MRSNSLSVLQIGDVHLPEFRDERILDCKDSGFPDQIIQHIAPSKLQRVMQKILSLIELDISSKPSAVLIGGDLTTKGNLLEYGQCVDYLCKTLRLTEPTIWNQNQIHVVPGNHDIDRPAINPNAPLFEKFSTLNQSWIKKGLPVLVNASERHTTIEKTGRRIDVFSINSCLGCGAKEYLPSKIREQLNTLLTSSDFDIQAMQLDTPAFDDKALTQITDSIQSLTKTTLPFILSHHNILPQAEPRIELYTEAINGGLVRSRLSQLKRPIIYCHGHIHKDPVEIIVSPKAEKGRLISISAPLLKDGFNLIEIQFTRSGIPIGCILKPYRLKDDGEVKAEPNLRISLWGNRDFIKTASDDIVYNILSEVKTESKRFSTLRQTVKQEDGSLLEETDLMDHLLELEWAGNITIALRDEEFRHWQISRSEP